MKIKILAVLEVLLLILSGAAFAEGYPAELAEGGYGSCTIALDANITTGYEWSAGFLSGDSVYLNENESGYVSDPVEDNECGVGGTHYFKLDARHSGNSILRLTYARGADELSDEIIALAVVEDDLFTYALDITYAGVTPCIVLDVDNTAHSALLRTEDNRELYAHFSQEMPLPAPNEHIRIFTNGTFIEGNPAVADVITWESMPYVR